MKVRDLANIIHRRQPGNIQCWLRHGDYEARYKGSVPRDYDDPYLVLFYWIIRLMAMVGAKHNVVEPVDFIFDEKKTSEQRALRWYFQVKEIASKDMLRLLGNTPLFRSDQDVVPLQAADMLAWNLRRKLIRPDEHRSMPDLLDLIQPGMMAELPIDAHALRLLADAVNKSPHGESMGSILMEAAMAADGVVVQQVLNSDPEQFVLVIWDSERLQPRRSLTAMSENEARAELRKMGLSDADIEAAIRRGRENPTQ